MKSYLDRQITPKLRTPVFWIGLLTSLTCVFLSIHKLDWQQLSTLWHRIDYRWVAFGAAMILVHTLARAARWRALFTPPVPSLEVALTAMLIGQTMNALLPARSGDIPRIYWLAEQEGQSKARALGTMAAEKVLDLILLVVVLFLVPCWAPANPPWLTKATWGGAIALILLYLGLRAGLAWQEPLMNRLAEAARQHNIRWWLGVQERLARVAEGVQGLREFHLLWRGALLSLIAWFWGAAANLAVLHALGLPLSWPMALIVSAALRVGIALPSLPANVGVYEGTVLLALGVFGVEREVALSYGLLMHLVDLLPPLALTLGLVWRTHLGIRFSNEG